MTTPWGRNNGWVNHYFIKLHSGGLFPSYFYSKTSGCLSLKKINIAILAVLVHRSGLRGHLILRSASPFSNPSLLLVRSHEGRCPPVKIAENITWTHYVSFLSVACNAGLCLFAVRGNAVSHSRWYTPMNSSPLGVLRFRNRCHS